MNHSTDENNTVESVREADTPSADGEMPQPASAGLLQGFTGSGKAMTSLSIFLIVVLGAVAYMNAINITFHFPDGKHIVENTAMHSLATISDAKTHDDLTLVSAASLALNQILSDSARSFHSWNIGIHLLNALLVFMVTRKILGSGVPDVIPVLAGMLFAVHPLTTQTVNMLLSRSFLLSAFFVLLSVWSFLKASEKDTVQPRYWVLSLTAFVLAWACGPWGWAVPVLILMSDLTVTTRLRKSYYAVHGSYWILLMFIAIQSRAVSGMWASGAALTDAYALASETVWKTATLAFWPGELSVAYSPLEGGVIWGLALAASFAVFYRFRRAGFALVWVTVCAGAYSYWGQESAFREELSYLPLAGLTMLVPVLLMGVKSIPARQLLGGLCAVLIVACMAMTSSRNQIWRSEAALWIDAIDNCIECVEPLERLAILNQAEGSLMLRELQFGAQTLPEVAEAAREEAMSYIREAGDFYTLALTINPNSASMWHQLGRMQQLDEQPEAARLSFLRSLSLEPIQQSVMLGLADVAAVPNGIVGAVTYYGAAQRNGRLPATAVLRYSAFLADTGRYAEAQNHLQAHPVVIQQGNLQSLMQEVEYRMSSLTATRGGIQQAIQLNRDVADIVRLSAREYYFDGKYLMASYQLEEAHRLGQLSLDDWILLGVVRSHTRNIDGFIRSWSEGYPGQDAADAWRRLALGLAGDKRWNDALRVLQYRQESTGSIGLPHVLLGDMALERNAIQDAVGMYQQAMEAHPDAYEPWMAMARLAANTNQRNQNRQAVVGNFLREAENRGASVEVLDALRAQVGLTAPTETESSVLPERTIIR